MKRIIILTLSAGLVLSSCLKHEEESTSDESRIYLSAGTVETRSPYTGSVPSGSEPLNALVCVSTYAGSFPENEGEDGTVDGNIGKHIQTQFLSGSSQLINGAYYNKDHVKPVYFTAFHPQSDSWTFTTGDGGGTEASFTFGGSDDVMFAPCVTGQYGASTPKLKFSHLLTWIKLEIKAENEAVAAAWGPLETVGITSASNISIAIDSKAAEFTNPVILPFYQTGSPDEEFPAAGGYAMTTDMKEVAYILCAPVIATEKDDFETSKVVRTAEYNISISSRYRQNITVPVDLMSNTDTYFAGTTAGSQFTLCLTFKMGNTIAVSASITDWETGGVGFGKIEE